MRGSGFNAHWRSRNEGLGLSRNTQKNEDRLGSARGWDLDVPPRNNPASESTMSSSKPSTKETSTHVASTDSRENPVAMDMTDGSVAPSVYTASTIHSLSATAISSSTTTSTRDSWGTPVPPEVADARSKPNPYNWGTAVPPGTGDQSGRTRPSTRPPNVVVHNFAEDVGCGDSTISGVTGKTGDEVAKNQPSGHTYSSVLPPTTSFAPPPRPFYPHKTTEVPKSALHALYGKRRKSLEASDYITWHNAGPPHDLYWTCVFVCPITAELFLTKPYKGASTQGVRLHDGLYWYKKKTNAEHGAAALAHDCWTFRDFRVHHPQIEPFTMTLADGQLPYRAEEAIQGLPAAVPAGPRQSIQNAQQLVQGQAMPPEGATVKEEMAWEKHPNDNAQGAFQGA